MDNKISISFGPEDSNGNVLMTIGKVNHFEEQRRHLAEALPILIERTWAVLAYKDMTPEQREVLEEVAEGLADIEAMLNSEAL